MIFPSEILHKTGLLVTEKPDRVADGLLCIFDFNEKYGENYLSDWDKYVN